MSLSTTPRHSARRPTCACPVAPTRCSRAYVSSIVDPPPPAAGPQRVNLAWLAGYVRSRRWALAGVMALAAVSSALAVAQPYLSKLVIDEGLIARRLDVLIWLCLAML